MALQISENNGTFELKGKLTSTTTRSFMNHFKFVMNTMKNITVNIDQVETIDMNGVEALKTLITMALKSNKKFSVIGYGCKDIYDDYKTSMVA